MCTLCKLYSPQKQYNYKTFSRMCIVRVPKIDNFCPKIDILNIMHLSGLSLLHLYSHHVDLTVCKLLILNFVNIQIIVTNNSRVN